MSCSYNEEVPRLLKSHTCKQREIPSSASTTHTPPSHQRKDSTHPAKQIKYFAGWRHPLSNFYPCRLVVDGRSAKSSEALYHYLKAVDLGQDAVAEQIRTAADAGIVKKIVNRKLKHLEDHRWHAMRVHVMDRVLRVKFQQCPAFRKELLDSKDMKLVENVPSEPFWGCGFNGEGRNVMGERLMVLAKNPPELLAFQPQIPKQQASNKCRTFQPDTPPPPRFANKAPSSARQNPAGRPHMNEPWPPGPVPPARSLDRLSPLPRAVVIGHSHLRDIDPHSLSPYFTTELYSAYNIPQAQKVLSNIPNPHEVEVVILHLITNDVSSEISVVTATKMAGLSSFCCDYFQNARILVSTGISRNDSELLNSRMCNVNCNLWDTFRDHHQVQLINNDSLGYNGWPNTELLQHDGLHLNSRGTRLLASNMRLALERH